MRINRAVVSIVISAGLALFITGCQTEQKQITLETPADKVSYAIGLDIGQDILGQKLGLNPELLQKGIQDGLAGTEPLLDEEESAQVRASFVEERRAVQNKERLTLAEKNLKEGEAFLTENAAKDGVISLPSGLQYLVIEAGNGATPTADDNVKVHYRGSFVDGSEFENSYAQESPAVFPVRGVIPGWTEALQLMPEGAKWKLFIPANLAYGEQGAGNKIGPNQALIFEIELLGTH